MDDYCVTIVHCYYQRLLCHSPHRLVILVNIAEVSLLI